MTRLDCHRTIGSESYLSGKLPFLMDDEGSEAEVGGGEHRVVDRRGVQGLGRLPPEGADDPVSVRNDELIVSVTICDDFQFVLDLSQVIVRNSN